jgi:hypothetical protein
MLGNMSQKNIIMRLRWAGNAVHMGDSRDAYRVLVGKPGERRPF